MQALAVLDTVGAVGVKLTLSGFPRAKRVLKSSRKVVIHLCHYITDKSELIESKYKLFHYGNYSQ